MKIPKNTFKVAAYIALLFALIGGIYIGANQLAGQQKYSANNTTSQEASNKTQKDNKEYIAYKGVKGDNALKTLKEVNKSVVTKTSDFGEYVDSVNNLQGGTDGKYWSFYVNGELASIGADSYIATGEETIEWKFVNLQ